MDLYWNIKILSHQILQMHNFINNCKNTPVTLTVSNTAVISPARGPLPALLDWPLSHPATCPPPSQMGLLWKICDINTVNSNVNFLFPWMIMSLMHQDKYVSSHPKHKQNWLNSPNSKLSIKLDCAHTQITNRNVTLTSIKRRIF